MNEHLEAAPAARPDDDVPPEWRERDRRLREIQAQEKAEADRAAAAELAKAKASLGIPLDFLELIEGGLARETPPLAELRKAPFTLLVLAGDVGCGKSVAACSWLLEGAREKPRPLFVTAARLSRWERYKNDEMDRLLLASRLVIDDLGNEFNDAKGNFLAVLDEVIADRVANRRPTVITTNVDANTFVASYGDRVKDRLKGAGRFHSFAGKSLRGVQIGLLPVEDGHR